MQIYLIEIILIKQALLIINLSFFYAAPHSMFNLEVKYGFQGQRLFTR